MRVSLNIGEEREIAGCWKGRKRSSFAPPS